MRQSSWRLSHHPRRHQTEREQGELAGLSSNGLGTAASPAQQQMDPPRAANADPLLQTHCHFAATGSGQRAASSSKPMACVRRRRHRGNQHSPTTGAATGSCLQAPSPGSADAARAEGWNSSSSKLGTGPNNLGILKSSPKKLESASAGDGTAAPDSRPDAGRVSQHGATGWDGGSTNKDLRLRA